MELCKICGSAYHLKGRSPDDEYRDICLKCRQIVKEEAPGVSLFSNPSDYSWDVSAMVSELEERMPGLFVGPVCPGDCTCNCTYESGCYILNNQKGRPRGRKSPGRPKKSLTK